MNAFAQQLSDAISRVNGRTISPLTIQDVKNAISIANLDPQGIGFVTGATPHYAWADRHVPAVLAWRCGDEIILRFKRVRHYRGQSGTPASWPELRGFPKGEVRAKLEQWRRAADAIAFPASSSLD